MVEKQCISNGRQSFHFTTGWKMDCKIYALSINSDFEHSNVTEPQTNTLFQKSTIYLSINLSINLEA